MFKQKTHNKLILVCLILISQLMTAQDVPHQVYISVGMEPVLTLNIEPDLELEFGIMEINEELYHVTKQPEDILFSVASTTSWNLSISSESPYFASDKNPENKIPVEFVGYTIENLGTNWDNGAFSNIINKSKDTILELSSDRTGVLTNGRRNNLGGDDKNSFIIHWELLWDRNAIRMKSYSKKFMTDERFKVNVRLTLSESLCTNCY